MTTRHLLFGIRKIPQHFGKSITWDGWDQIDFGPLGFHGSKDGSYWHIPMKNLLNKSNCNWTLKRGFWRKKLLIRLLLNYIDQSHLQAPGGGRRWQDRRDDRRHFHEWNVWEQHSLKWRWRQLRKNCIETFKKTFPEIKYFPAVFLKILVWKQYSLKWRGRQLNTFKIHA